MDLDSLLEKVNSRQTFLAFVKALRDDKIDEEKKEEIKKSNPYGSGANGWENGSIEAFLEAIHSGEIIPILQSNLTGKILPYFYTLENSTSDLCFLEFTMASTKSS